MKTKKLKLNITLKKLTLFFLAGIFLFTAGSLIFMPGKKNSTSSSFGLYITNSANVMLTAYAEEVDPEAGTVSKVITATVLPETAPDKTIDWTISVLNTDDENIVISDYITLTPSADTLQCTVTALQGFIGKSFCITATTKVGGYTANCKVFYDGAPERLSITYEGVDYALDTKRIKLTANNTYNFTLGLDNTLGVVGSSYGNYEIVSMQGCCRFVALKEYIVNGPVVSSEDVILDLEVGSYTYTNEASLEEETVTFGPERFFTASITGNVLTINAIKNESSFDSTNGVYPRTGYRFTYKSAYTDPRANGVADDCYWVIGVKDTVSGLTDYLYIDIESTVTSLALSKSRLVF